MKCLTFKGLTLVHGDTAHDNSLETSSDNDNLHRVHRDHLEQRGERGEEDPGEEGQEQPQ